MKIRPSGLPKATLLSAAKLKGYAAFYREHIEGIDR